MALCGAYIQHMCFHDKRQNRTITTTEVVTFFIHFIKQHQMAISICMDVAEYIMYVVSHCIFLFVTNVHSIMKHSNLSICISYYLVCQSVCSPIRLLLLSVCHNFLKAFIISLIEIVWMVHSAMPVMKTTVINQCPSLPRNWKMPWQVRTKSE